MLRSAYPPRGGKSPRVREAAQSKAINAFTGSLAFVASARLAFVAVEEAETDRHLLLAVKNNLGPKADGIGYRIEQGATPQGIITSRIIWDSDPVTVTANEALAAAQENRKGDARREAETFLEGYLEAQPIPAATVEAAAKENGISPRTLRRARESLNCQDKADWPTWPCLYFSFIVNSCG
jgi:putative DNA primase/helicase